MKNLLNFFFSFDKLFKEKLIVPFFWLSLIVVGLAFLEEGFRAIKLPPLGAIAGFINFFALLLLSLLAIRIVAELAVAIYRINDNLSPDGGKSELADIDPVAEARKAAEHAASRTREATRSVSEKATEATKNLSENVKGKAKAASASVSEKAGDLKSKAASKTTKADGEGDLIIDPPKTRGRPKGSTNKSTKSTTKAKKANPIKASDAPKKRGRPAGSKNKTTASKTTTGKTSAAKSTSTGKRGPKPGTKIPRDADGNLLKKDGTPRKKPGPKK